MHRKYHWQQMSETVFAEATHARCRNTGHDRPQMLA
jgi:hypothetical protein